MPVPIFLGKVYPGSWAKLDFLKILHRYIDVLSDLLLINTHPTNLASDSKTAGQHQGCFEIGKRQVIKFIRRILVKIHFIIFLFSSQEPL